MKYLLSRQSLPIVARLALERTLCAFDFDGTLAPIVARPEQAELRVRTRHLLRQLVSLYPCIVVSGRARADLQGKLGDVLPASVIGNHGAETEAAPANRERVQQWKRSLELDLGTLQGVWVEDKGHSLAVHYRQSTEPAKALRLIAAAAQKLRHGRIFGGKQVVNVTADDAPHKGDAVAGERSRLDCDWVLYVGDDVNDEDAFALEGNVVAVRIGRKKHSQARYFLRAQAEIDTLLEALVRLRRSATGA